MADDKQRVPWDEAREVLAMVLLIAAVGYVTGPLVRHLAVDGQFEFWDDLRVILSNVNITTGLLLVAAAINEKRNRKKRNPKLRSLLRSFS